MYFEVEQSKYYILEMNVTNVAVDKKSSLITGTSFTFKLAKK